MSKDHYDLHVTCNKHQRPLEGGQPQLFRKVGRGEYVISLDFLFCPGMWRNNGENDEDEITEEICWDYWVVEVVKV